MKNIRRIAAALLCLVLLCSASAALAYSFADNYPLYIVESYQPNGYCYLYDQPSDITGRNLGRYNNGAFMKVIQFNAKNGYAHVICQDGKVGYVHNYSITQYMDTYRRPIYRIYSTSPAGYCYLYDKPSSVNGKNLGRHNNGEYVEVLDWDASDQYARVQCWKDGKYGYIAKTALVYAGDSMPYDDVAYVNSTQPKGYCYLYDKPSSVKGRNLGRHNNGEAVFIINWDADSTYAQVECMDGKIGYINKNSLER
ncbi:MAG: hypothetical protein E7329_06000 [Clostridiales bacterium]|nr:hypothetical protein [Clostridiales bacterium]